MLSSRYALKAVQNLLEDHKTELTSGIIIADNQQPLNRITLTSFTFPYNYPFVRINVLSAETASDGYQTSAYDIALELCSVAYQQAAEADHYETHTLYFEDLSDRICTLLRETEAICGDEYCFVVDGEVTKVNVSGLQADTGYPMLGYHISFRLLRC